MLVSVGTPTAAAVGYEKGDVSDVIIPSQFLPDTNN